MPMDEQLNTRIRAILSGNFGIEEKRMFGGIAFLLYGNLLVGASRRGLLVRVGPEAAAKALKDPRASQFENNGRPMKGWLMVETDGLSDDAIRSWLERALAFVTTLPAK